MAADPGFEPGFRVPETRVLPLHQSARTTGTSLIRRQFLVNLFSYSRVVGRSLVFY